ncbi:MAG: AAA family ATPase [Planctomycetes bacterium]|nr:AAA family ATPase [Planctomycetota bacterium]
MIVVVTGMVGIDKKQYLQGVCRHAAEQHINIQQFNVGDRMYKEAPDIPPGKILDVPMQRLNSLRRSVFKDIIAQSGAADHTVVNTHATFRWRHGLFPAVDFDQMRQLNADMYICLMDGVAALHRRLKAEHALEHTLKDLMVWREEEMIGTDMLRRGIDDHLPFYSLARGNTQATTQTFFNLLFKPAMKRAYLSFPMTAVMDLPKVREQIDRFRQTMYAMFVCFDPGDVEDADLPHLAREARNQGKDHVDHVFNGQAVPLNAAEILQIEQDINSQTYARDFMLIDQSHMIISFIPTLADGRASISSGVERELQHAHEGGKEVYVIWTAKMNPSVFVTQTATRVFKSTHEAIAYFGKKGYTAS